MRNAGIGLTIAGSVHLGVGLALVGVAVAQASQPCDSGGCADFPNGLAAGIFAGGFLGVSVVLAAIGVPLWVVGSRPPEGAQAAGTAPSWARAVPRPAANGIGWSF
jgi:hypothetical protein